MEKREINTPEFNASGLFDLIHNNTMEGFFADPIYGGNRDMAGWKLLGFPGTRYEDWPLEDPAGQGVEAVRPIRDAIRARVEALIDDLVPA